MLYKLHPCRSIRKQIWLCHKNGRQYSVIIWTNLVVLEYPLLYTKFQSHRPIGSKEGDFLRFLPYMGLEAMLVMWPRIFEHIFIPTSHGGSIWNLASNGLVFFFWEKKFDNVESEWPWTKVNEWPWPWVDINHHVLIYLTIYTNFQLFLGNLQLKHFPIRKKRSKFDLVLK